MQNELTNILNMLCNINVKGQDAITMAQVLLALKDIIEKTDSGVNENGN